MIGAFSFAGGNDFSSPFTVAAGMPTAPLICPLLASSAERTSRMIAGMSLSTYAALTNSGRVDR